MNQPIHLVLWAVLAVFALACPTLSQSPPILPSQVDDFATLLIITKSPQERSTLLANKKDLLTPDLRRALIRQGNVHLMAGQYASAFEIYGIARTIAEQIGDKEGVATAYLDTGTVYYFQANYTSALEHYHKARELFTEVNNQYESAKALSGLAMIYKEQRREGEALAALKQTLAEFTELADKEEMANTLSSIGSIYYGQGNYTAAAEAFLKSSELNTNGANVLRIADALYMQGDYAQALTYYKQALNQNDSAEMIAALNGAANSAYYQGNYEEALKYFQQNFALEKTQRDRLGMANSLRGIGNVHRSLGDYGAALENYFKSLELLRELKAITGTLLGSIGLVRALQGNIAAALEFYDKALEQFENDGNKIDMARALSLIGNAQYAQGKYVLAIDSYRKGLALREAMDDKSGQADLLVGLGTVFLRMRDFTQALTSYEAALKLIEATGNRPAIAATLTRVADVYLLQSNYTETLNIASRAATLARETASADALWYAQLLIGKAQRGLDQPTQAQQSFASATAIVESLRSQPTTAEMDGGRNTLLPYHAAIDLFIEQNKAAEAFDNAERAKVEALFQLFRRGNARSVKGLTPKEDSDERNLIGQTVSLELQLERETQSRTSTEARRSALRDRIRQTRAAFADLRRKLFVAHPRLKVERGEIASLKLAESGALITDHQTALLEYAITERDAYLFVLTLDKTPRTTQRTQAVSPAVSIKAYPLNVKNDELFLLVKRLEETLTHRDDAVVEPLRQLYDLLLKPASEQLGKRTKLVIVPDGVLWRVPFAALQPEADRYLLDQMEVSYAPSFAALREMRKPRRGAATVSLVAFGNPTLAKEFTERVKLAYDEVKMEASTEQEREITQVGTLYRNAQKRLFVGDSASEERLKLEAAHAGILHIATATVLDDTSPMSSFVGLSSGATGDDGFLQTREVLNLQTPARLVVVSAAQERGEYFGSAAASLSWSWFVAGAPTMVFNRWKVNSPAVTQIMTELHTRLKTVPRITKARAVGQSALLLRNSSEFGHPFFWSGFSVIGDAR
ncbi:MAG TPA: tetratricopeptide repeat protein [Pyrinomonadaceae bacterium]|nr:tetratricopeptide repeat protein [Pyrinomonadaceae bacterium]